MCRHAVAVMCSVLSVAVPTIAQAGPFEDEMASCLVRSTTEADRTSLVRWMFSLAALHPAVESLAVVSASDRAEVNRSAARLVERLLVESCPAQAKDAFRHEGPAVIGGLFRALGQVASQGLFSDPAIGEGSAAIGRELDRSVRVQELLEAP